MKSASEITTFTLHSIMQLLRSSAAAVALLASSVTVAAAQPTLLDTQGYLKYVGSTDGAPSVDRVKTGPYRAQFGPTAGSVAPDVFNVYCFDWLGRVESSSVKIVSFSQATTSGATGVVAGLQSKFAQSAATSGGLTMNKLNAAAWLSTQMVTANQAAWDEMHVALWNIFWDSGVGSPDLRSLTYRSSSSQSRAQHWYDLAMSNTNFDGSNFRIFVPTKEVTQCLKYTWTYSGKKCTESTTYTAFDKDKQLLFAELPGGGEPGIVTPEPGTWALMTAGLFALGVVARRRRQS